MKLTHEEFVIKANEVHNKKYSYPEQYIDFYTKITINCELHGDFKQAPRQHINLENGCKKCGNLRQAKSQKYTIDDYHKLAEKMNLIFCDDEIPKNTNTKSNWKCKKEGHLWETTYHSIMQGADCFSCSKVTQYDSIRKTLDKFISEAKAIHGDKYNYSKVIYKNGTSKVEIICNKDKHGIFWQEPHAHINKAQGCPKCTKFYSENLCRELFEDLTAKSFIKTKLKFLNRLELDGYCDKLKLAFEYQGIQHYKFVKRFHVTEDGLKIQQERDIRKKKLCMENGIKIIEVPYKYTYATPIQMQVFIMIELEKLGFIFQGGYFRCNEKIKNTWQDYL